MQLKKWMPVGTKWRSQLMSEKRLRTFKTKYSQPTTEIWKNWTRAWPPDLTSLLLPSRWLPGLTSSTWCCDAQNLKQMISLLSKVRGFIIWEHTYQWIIVVLCNPTPYNPLTDFFVDRSSCISPLNHNCDFSGMWQCSLRALHPSPVWGWRVVSTRGNPTL